MTGRFPKQTLYFFFDRDFVGIIYIFLFYFKGKGQGYYFLENLIKKFLKTEFLSYVVYIKPFAVARLFDFNQLPTSTLFEPLRTISIPFSDFLYPSHTFIMDKIKTPKEDPQEKTESQPMTVEDYQKKWDQMLQDTAKQIDKIRGELIF